MKGRVKNMDLEELTKILDFCKRSFPNKSLYLKSYGGFDWYICSGDEVILTWDSDHIKTYDEFLVHLIP